MAEDENAGRGFGRSAGFVGRTVRSRRLMAALVAVAVVCGVVVMLVYAYNKGRQHGAAGEPPIVRAQKGPIKVRPEEPGGMTVPDRDKEVFTRLETGNKPVNVERLLPPPDNPVEHPSAPPGDPVPSEPPETGQSAKAPETGQSTTAPDSSSDPEVVRRIRSGHEIVLRKKPPPPPPPRAAAGAFAVQIASLTSEAAVRGQWSELKRRHPDLLRGLSLSIDRKVSKKGVHYRMRAGPLPDRTAAKRLCDQLSRRKIGCLIVRRQQ